VTDAHYDSVGAALLWTLEQGLGDAWMAEAKAAWAAA
jgi:hemoglobin-like flavoprotein